MNLHDLFFNATWSLFLDRDGVINRRIVGGYVKEWSEFQFLEGSLEAIKILSGTFGRIFVVSNQQGVGKGMMTSLDVEGIHSKMLESIRKYGGKIDKAYFSPHLEEDGHPDRKPGTGMALKAKNDFPDIELSRSVLVGDSVSDMQFGRNIGAINILIINHEQIEDIPADLYDVHFPSLLAFAKELKTKN